MPSPTPSFGTSMSLVSAEPPNARRSSGRTMCRSASWRRDRPRRLQLDPVALAVVDRQRDHRKARLARQRRADHRIEPAGQEDDRAASQLDPQPRRRPEPQRVERQRADDDRSPCSPRSRTPDRSSPGSARNSGSEGRMNQKVLTASSATRSASCAVAPQPDHRQQRGQRQRRDQPAPAGIAPRDLRHGRDDQRPTAQP